VRESHPGIGVRAVRRGTRRPTVTRRAPRPGPPPRGGPSRVPGQASRGRRLDLAGRTAAPAEVAFVVPRRTSGGRRLSPDPGTTGRPQRSGAERCG
jgi:hypothetical protein